MSSSFQINTSSYSKIILAIKNERSRIGISKFNNLYHIKWFNALIQR